MPSRPDAGPLRNGFGLLELLTAIAFLVIVMGLMVSLARYVRATSAERITRTLLRQLDIKMAAGRAEPAFDADALPPPAATEASWFSYARAASPRLSEFVGTNDPVTDAWGNPIVYLPAARPDIGMAPGDRPFCVSPGPDGRYLTQADNLYSYEELLPSRVPPAQLPPARVPVDTANNPPAGAKHDVQ